MLPLNEKNDPAAKEDFMNQPKKTSPFRYAVGMFGTSIPINMFKTYAAAFYVIGHGVTTAQFSMVLFFYTFVDAIDNPVYGFLSDRTRTRWGRRRPWLVIGAPLLALCFIGFFNIPAGPVGGGIVSYMLLMYILTGTLDSLINANYGALFPELFTSDAERAKSNAMRQAFQLLAMVISIALTPLVTDALGYGLTSILYGSLAVAVILYCTFGCHETAQAEELQKPRLLATLRDLLTNPKFWIFGLTNAFYSAAMSLVMSAVPFYVKYTLGLDSMANTVLLGMVLLFAMAGVSVWAAFVKKHSLMPVWRIALIALTLSFLPLYFVSGLIPAVAASCLLGFGYAGAITTMDLIGARIMDEDTRKNGLRREGTYASAMGFMNRLSGFFTSFAFLIVGRIYGFESGEIPGPRPHDAARFLMVVFPLCVMAVSVLCSRFLKFPEAGAGSPSPSEDGAAKKESV